MKELPGRVAELVALFEAIARTRMAGLPVLNPALTVEAVGFAPFGDAHAIGVLVTPWFMNLLRLPRLRVDDASGIGRTVTIDFNGRHIGFTGAHEGAIGAFEACSLYSPVFEFPTHPLARATAEAVLTELRGAPAPARRAFLLGRGAAAAR